jgi:hypothetical protein
MITGIHGIGYQRLTALTEQPKWRGALAKGLENACVDATLADQLRFLAYGDLFLRKGMLASVDPDLDASDVEGGFETQLLRLWYQEAVLKDPNLPKPEDPTRPPAIPGSVQKLLDALSQSRTFAGLAERALILNLKQVHRYMADPVTRSAIQARITQNMPTGTRLVISHSLGTVVAYEAICAHPEWNIEGLITMGSPLGIRNLIFDRLNPKPGDVLGEWPKNLRWWVNVADEGDVVAIEKDLRNRFGSAIDNWIVDNGIAEVHGAEKYLAQSAVGAALRRLA